MFQDLSLVGLVCAEKKKPMYKGVAAVWETFQDPERIAKPSDLVRVAAQAREAVEEESHT